MFIIAAYVQYFCILIRSSNSLFSLLVWPTKESELAIKCKGILSQVSDYQLNWIINLATSNDILEAGYLNNLFSNFFIYTPYQVLCVNVVIDNPQMP